MIKTTAHEYSTLKTISRVSGWFYHGATAPGGWFAKITWFYYLPEQDRRTQNEWTSGKNVEINSELFWICTSTSCNLSIHLK